ncbi:MAG: hypothetical protein ACYDD1_20400 [Caulobacteraceae bacterium]
MAQDPEDNAEHSHATENDNMKGGKPPRPATEPHGSKGSSESEHTMTDPATGAPKPGATSQGD